MNTQADIRALCCEFTDALTEVLAENAIGAARRGRVARAHAAVKRHPNTMNMHFVWQWRLRLCNGKPYKTRLINLKRAIGYAALA